MVNEIFIKVLLALAIAALIADILWIAIKAVILVSLCIVKEDTIRVNFKPQLWVSFLLSAGIIYYFL